MYYTDPTTGKIVATDATGAMYADPGMGFGFVVANLEQHSTWQAGTVESHGANPCVGIAAWRDPNQSWGYCYITRPTSGHGSFGPYDLYHFRRTGTPN